MSSECAWVMTEYKNFAFDNCVDIIYNIRKIDRRIYDL